jgi:hypothetical protein
MRHQGQVIYHSSQPFGCFCLFCLSSIIVRLGFLLIKSVDISVTSGVVFIMFNQRICFLERPQVGFTMKVFWKSGLESIGGQGVPLFS